MTMVFGGAEINLQHKFETRSRLQPYGKVGLGVYGLGEDGSDVNLIGAGINLALGVDFFFARHFGIGAEVMYKKLDYFQQSTTTPEGGPDNRSPATIEWRYRWRCVDFYDSVKR